jgi:hypothetical protein
MGSVLLLPSGSRAISPPVCLSNAYPLARTEVRDLSGTQGVRVYVAYQRAGAWEPKRLCGSVAGATTTWSLPSPFGIPPPGAGWHLARFTLAAEGTASAYEISNFYIEHRMP